MAEVVPFRMVQYNGNCAKELDLLITPPYDVISPEEQEAFYQLHPLNMIRLVLGKRFPEDTQTDNRYTRAASTLKAWLDDKTLVQVDRPGLVVYQMEFRNPDGMRNVIDGLVALAKVDSYGIGKVLPHEKTYKGPKQDQLNLLRACRTHLTPIHALFSDEDHLILKEYERAVHKPPSQEVKDREGVIHRTWTLHDEAAIANIQKILESKSLFIADGHHRYETSLAFKDEMRSQGRPDLGGGHEYVMMYLTSMSHPGLSILPAHRMLKGLPEVNVEKVLRILEPYFEIEMLCLEGEDRHSVAKKLVDKVSSLSQTSGNYGIAFKNEDCFRLLKLKDFKAVDPLIGPEYPPTLRNLDVTILREIVIGLGFGLNNKDNAEGMIEYTPSPFDALNRVEEGDIQVSFILNPTRVEQVRAAAELGHKLPHKSTYFYPKLSSGLVLNVF